MSKRVALSVLNASTIDILNTIRANAPLEYQSSIPAITQEDQIPAVGELICGYPNYSNYFLNALMSRIAFVNIKSATFNNAYADLKKGMIEYGKTIEEVFVEIAKAREFSAEKAYERELKRSVPDVRAAFHTINWRVQYPITVQEEDLRTAFVSAEGVTDLIARLVASVTAANEYDEYLLFKYLMIKAITKGQMHSVALPASYTTEDTATTFRSISNNMTFIKTDYNAMHVHTNTSKEDQQIFMDATFNAKFDVEILSRAFNMDKAEFMGRLRLIDDWTTFDNERFDVIRTNCDAIEEVTAAELAAMAKVKAVIVDKEWFQIYDNLAKMTETYVGSGMYWNYFFNVWKTVSSSPFSNAVVVIDPTADALDDDFQIEIIGKTIDENNTVFTFDCYEKVETTTTRNLDIKFLQTEDLTEDGVAVHPYGAIIVPATYSGLKLPVGVRVNGVDYTAEITLATADVGDITDLVEDT